MPSENRIALTGGGSASERAMESPELIDRLAEELRTSSDVDLPHSYFVEQVKLRLAGKTTDDHHVANDTAQMARQTAVNDSASVFKSWAIPDQH